MNDWIALVVRGTFVTALLVSTFLGIRKAGGSGYGFLAFMTVLIVSTSIFLFLIYDHGKYWFKLTER